MSKTYIAYNCNSVVIGFLNAEGELEYTTYSADDGGTLDDFSIEAFTALAEEVYIDEDIMEIKELL